MLEIFAGELFDPEARRALLALESKGPSNTSSLGGLRPLVAMSCDADIGIQQRAASSFVTLLELTQTGVSKQPPEQLAALVSLASRFTPTARSHATSVGANTRFARKGAPVSRRQVWQWQIELARGRASRATASETAPQ